MGTKSASASGGVGFGGLLLLLFIGLKLGNVIDWSWWWVTAPAWVPAAIATCFLLGAVIMATIGWLGDKWSRRKRALR